MDRILIRRYPRRLTEDKIYFDDLLNWDMWQSFLKTNKGLRIMIPQIHNESFSNDYLPIIQLIYQSSIFLRVLQPYFHLLDGLWIISVLRLEQVVSL